MATIQDVAKHAQVSTATVSHVINNNYPVSAKVRERVVRAVRDLNYHPNAMARGLRTRSSKTVGMIVPDIINPFFPAIVRAAEDVLNHAGYRLFVGNSDNALQKEEAYYRAFREKRVDGLLMIVAGGPLPPAFLRNHLTGDAPITFIDRYYRRLCADAVLVNNISGSHEAVTHLIDCGHRQIGIITGPLQLANANLRLEGYKRAMRERDISVDENLIAEGRFDIRSGYESTKRLLERRSPPSALFVSNCQMTTGCLQAISELGIRCPGDIAVVSFDDLDWFSFSHPAISAVAQPMYELGAIAAEMLLKRITKKLTGPPRKRMLATKLIVRESSGAK